MFRKILFTAVLTTVAAGVLASSAEARHRRQHIWLGFDRYDAGPIYVPVPRFYRYYEEPEYLPPDQFDQAYDQEPDDGYYEPKLKKPASKPQVAKTKKKAVPPATEEITGSTTPAKPISKQASVEKAATPAAAAVSCDKATSIVTGFGFSDVKPADCSGQVYAFNATRDGKTYAVKLNAASGQLTEVRKTQ